MTRIFGWGTASEQGTSTSGATAPSSPPSLVRKNRNKNKKAPSISPLSATPLRPRSASAGTVSPRHLQHRHTTPRSSSNQPQKPNRPRFASREVVEYDSDDDDSEEEDRLPFELLFHQAQQRQRASRNTSSGGHFWNHHHGPPQQPSQSPTSAYETPELENDWFFSVTIFTGAYVTVVLLVQVIVALLLSFHASSWTVTNILHLVVTLIYVHWLKGQSLLYDSGVDDQGELNAMTVWEQLEAATGRTSLLFLPQTKASPAEASAATSSSQQEQARNAQPTKPCYSSSSSCATSSLSTIQRVLLLIPTVLTYLACHCCGYDPVLSAINVSVWGVAMLAKLPFMNGVRLFGINRTVGIDDDHRRQRKFSMDAKATMTRDDDTATQEEEEDEYAKESDRLESSTPTAMQEEEQVGAKKKVA